MDNTREVIVAVRDSFESVALTMQSQLDQLSSLDSAQIADIVRDTVIEALKPADGSAAANPEDIADVIAENAVNKVLQRQRVGIPPLEIVNELTDFVRDEILKSLEHDLSITSVHAAKINYALMILQIIHELEIKEETIKGKLRTVAIAARADMLRYIDPADTAALSASIARRARIQRRDTHRIAQKALDEAVDLARRLAKEKYSQPGLVERLSSSYIAERGFLRLKHWVLKQVQDVKLSDQPPII